MVIVKASENVWAVLSGDLSYKYGDIYSGDILSFSPLANRNKLKAKGTSLIELLFNAGFTARQINTMRIYREE